ncbi:MAG: transglutaminase-like domain-containing protein [Oscillospiraceae bacterium]|nr:transglutaminase-like domain-containing protein [Oscillospiraceae bacterium]
MRKRIALLLCLLLLVPFAAGCTAVPITEPDAAEESPAAAEEPLKDPEEPADPAQQTPGDTEEAPPAETGETERETGEKSSHYRFQPKVCSSYMTEVFGEKMTETWFSLVDAVMAGEDSFACPDADTYWWVMGQYPDRCFPVLKDLIYYGVDVDHPVKDGVASFTYTVPREEAAARIADFAQFVEEILNETLEDDYSDMEKALTLYIYFSHSYIYDYEAARPDAAPDYLSSYRVFSTGTGICQEFSVAYSYLLLQAGVDASVMSGHRSYDGEGHQWSYVRINGRSFHIDPTYVIGDSDSLSYFMMDDAQREAADCYDREDFVICSHYSQEHPHPDYAADDDSFRAIWGGRFEALDHEKRILTYTAYNEQGELETLRFDYTGW